MDALSLLTVESDLVNSIDYDDVIDTFAEYKAGRKRIYGMYAELSMS